MLMSLRLTTLSRREMTREAGAALCHPTRRPNGGSKRLFHLRKPQLAPECIRLFQTGGQETLRRFAIKDDVLVELFKPAGVEEGWT